MNFKQLELQEMKKLDHTCSRLDLNQDLIISNLCLWKILQQENDKLMNKICESCDGYNKDCPTYLEKK